MFVISGFSLGFKPLLWQPPWWPHPSSPVPATEDPGHVLCPPPASVPGGKIDLVAVSL